MRLLLTAILITTIITSCDPSRRAIRRGEAENRNLPELVISANDPRYTYRKTTPITWDITDTRVSLSFNWKEKTAAGEVWIQVQPYFEPKDTLVLDAKSMKIISVSQEVAGKEQAVKYSYENDQLTLIFDKKYRATENIKLHIQYEAMPYGSVTGGSAAIIDDRGLYFINTGGEIPGKPRQIWTQGETEANSHWLPTIDKPNERFTVQVELLVPDTMQTLGNGIKLSSNKEGSGMRRDIWKMDKPIQAYAIMFAIGRFSIVKDKWKDKEVSYYVEPEYAPFARMMFNNTPEMMDFFSHITGVLYPWQKYDQVVVRDYVSGAMENTTASLYGEFMNQDFREIADGNYEDIVSHELFHQWFGDYVTQESWSHLTVSESFANYGEQLWRKHKYGEESADKLGYEDKLKYLNANKGKSPALVRFYYSHREDMFDRISYEKGGAILHYLHGLMGDEAFYKAMNIYLTKNALSSAEATHWRLAVEEATGRDWAWFFNQFYLAGGHPNLDVKYTYDDKGQMLYVEVTQMPTDSTVKYTLPLRSILVSNGYKTEIDWKLEKKKEVFTYPYENGVKPIVIVDINDWLPGNVTENKTPEQWLVQYLATEKYVARRIAINEAAKTLADNNSKKVFDNALLSGSSLLKEHALAHLANVKGEENISRWKLTLENLTGKDEDNHVREASFRVLGKWQVYAAKEKMLAAVSDSSYMVAGAALKALNILDGDTAYAIARQLLEQPVKAQLKSVVEDIVAARGKTSDITYFEQTAPYVYGKEKLAFVSTLTTYLEVVNDMPAFKRGLEIVTDLARKEEIKSYRSYITTNLISIAKYLKKNTPENAQKKEAIKKAGEELIQAEPDENNKKAFRKLMDDILGEKK